MVAVYRYPWTPQQNGTSGEGQGNCIITLGNYIPIYTVV